MNQNGLLKDKTALVIDPLTKYQNDRTWGFWAKKDEAIPFQEIIYKQWPLIEFHSQFFSKIIDIAPYNYYLIRGIDFYEYALESLEKNRNIKFLKDKVEGVSQLAGKIILQTSTEQFAGNYLFDSRFKQAKTEGKTISLKQHFKGYIIETPKAQFNPKQIKLFDFRTPQKGLMRFFYVLPFSETKALVEYTLFSENLLEETEYDMAIEEYLAKILNINDYQILEKEMGLIPMSNQKINPLKGNILKIGTAGGTTKASSGYTFNRIQEHTKLIVESILEKGTPSKAFPNPKRFQLYDSMMLQVLHKRGDQAEKVFSDLFQNNDIKKLFAFLDEKTSLIDDIKIMNSVPKGLFLKAGWDLLFR